MTQQKQLTLGSLFSGSGGFELAGYLCGVKPVWASEIEPFPIRVTTKRFPNMKHLGDIRAINGAKIPPVDIVAMGSPCQNLSLSGRREGLTGKESSLFFEAIRIIKEMRKETKNEKPRYIIWENVPGAMSSGTPRGEDFRTILSEIVGIAEPGAEVPACGAKGWAHADTILGAGWSLAYRTVDAQYFGVPQRRRRIYLIADFGSERAGDLLFEREGVRRDFAQGFRTWEEFAGASANGSGSAVAFEPGAASRLGGHAWEGGPVGALRADMGDNQTAAAIPINTQVATRHIIPDAGGFGVGGDGDPAYALQAKHSHAVAIDNHPADSRVKIREDGVVQTLSTRMGTGGGNGPLVFGISSYDSFAMKSPNPHAGIYEAKTARTLDRSGGNPGCNQGGIAIVCSIGQVAAQAY
jgi:DNA (cytosine-5)-methyltransferase 1